MAAPDARTSRSPAEASAEQIEEGRACIVASDADDRKPFYNLRAAYALAGYAVHELSCGGFLVARWNLTRHCPDLHALATFARQIGVRV